LRGGKPVGDESVRLALPTVRDPDAEALVAQITATGPPSLQERGVEGARIYLEERAAAAPAGPSLHEVFDDVIEVAGSPVPVRVYRATPTSGVPVVVYFHGGGWVIGSLNASDAFCRRLAKVADCVVVSVEYPLAPEHPFPGAVESAVVAIEWAAGRSRTWGADDTRLVVLGDSAGANIATVAVGRLARRNQALVCRQILAYPGVTAERGATGNPFALEWPLLDTDRVWFIDQYVTEDAERIDPDVAPLLGDIPDLPPTTLLLGGCDPLVAEGLAYANRLWAAGVSVDLHLYAGQIHGFLTFDDSIMPRSGEAVGLVANAIQHS
jgi:acetyl esterase